MLNERLKVVHAPLEIAGQVGLLCDFLKKFNIHAVGYNYFPNYLNYERVINTDSYELAKILEHSIDYYDLFHFHNGYTFLDDFRDIEMIRATGKPIIMHHRGNDVRSRVRSRRWADYENPYVNAESSVPDDLIDHNLKYFSQHVCAAIVQDYELMPYVEDYYAEQGKKVYVLPRLFDIAKYKKPTLRKNRKDEILIVHAPTQREFKGTDQINQAIEKLRRDVPSVRYQLVEEVSHAEALQIYRKADIIIDQVLCGAYGNLSVEGMALGKPVVCYIRPDLVSKYPSDLPIVSANPDTLYDVLHDLVSDHELRAQLGRQGWQYVRDQHSAEMVAQSLLSIYEEVLKEGNG